MGERDLMRILAHPAAMVASDGEVTVFGRAVPHPRSYGSFARVLYGPAKLNVGGDTE
jgi:N-acyl-D-aspartate/D-glutamate deacylase